MWKIDDFFSRVTSKFCGWPWKTIEQLFYATSSFVHHFVAIGEFKLELHPGNAQFGSNSIFRAVWPWNLTDDLEKQKGTSMLLQALCIISYLSVNSNWSYSPETLNLGQNRRYFEQCDLQTWQMTLKNISAPILCNSKLCASFVAIGEFQLVLQSGNAQFWSKSTIFEPCDLQTSRMTLKNNKASLLRYIKFCASFQCHR